MSQSFFHKMMDDEFLIGDGDGDVDEPVSKRANDGVERRTIALLFGYLGSNYQGLQVNPGAFTVEGVLYKALCRARVLELDADAGAPDLASVQWQRTARTDKGVHAAGAVVSFRARLVPSLVSAVNQELPYDVRVFGYRVTTHRFRCKENCEARTYEMRVPTFVLLTPTPADSADLYAYRVPPARLDQLRATLALFEGTHNFHNYTSGRAPADPSCKRFMRRIELDAPALVAGIEFFTVRLVGQSFMLHQIRKMIGTAVMLLRYDIPRSAIKRTLQTEKFTLPLIPGVGLAVVRCWFTGYDKKVAAIEGLDPLTWQAEQPLVDAYLRDVIVPHVAALELGDYQVERARQRAAWLAHVSALKLAAGSAPPTAAAAAVAAAADADAAVDVDAADVDDDVAGAADDDADDDDKPPTAVAASSMVANMREQDVPSAVQESRKHPFSHWCRIVDRFPPDRATYLLHPSLRPLDAVAVVGRDTSAPLDATTPTSASIAFSSPIVPSVNERWTTGPVTAHGTLVVSADALNRPLELGVANGWCEQPTILLMSIAPQTEPTRIAVDASISKDVASLVPFDKIYVVGRHLLLVDAASREVLAQAVIGVRHTVATPTNVNLASATTSSKPIKEVQP